MTLFTGKYWTLIDSSGARINLLQFSIKLKQSCFSAFINGLKCVVNLSLRCNYVCVERSKFVVG